MSIIKQNQTWFPMKALFAVLKAWFMDQPSGHWVTMTAYPGSQRGVIYSVHMWIHRTIRQIMHVLL